MESSPPADTLNGEKLHANGMFHSMEKMNEREGDTGLISSLAARSAFRTALEKRRAGQRRKARLLQPPPGPVHRGACKFRILLCFPAEQAGCQSKVMITELLCLELLVLITDTTGSHQFPAMQRLSISKGHAFMLVYSVTSRQSVEELQPIYEQICQIKGDVQKVPIMLVGNKSDDTQREVGTSEGEVLATKWKCSFMETSAKMNYNVQELFEELLNLEKRRNVSLQVDGKKSKQQRKKDKLRSKCSVM
ncbi:GTP-binding protein Di-Ras3 isoform 2-T2 [Liasis olivaceus]